jgi:Ca2+-binding EF-hand superfamily protein
MSSSSAKRFPSDSHRSALALLRMRHQGVGIDNSTHLKALRSAGSTQLAFARRLRLAVNECLAEAPKKDSSMLPTEADLQELEAVERWSRFAELADADGDGVVDFGEFVTVLTLLELTPSELSLAFRVFDTDRSGLLEPLETDRLFSSLRGQSFLGSQVRDRNLLSRDLGRVTSAQASLCARISATAKSREQADSIRGGRLSLESLEQFRSTLATALRRVEYDQLDVDGSGKLSKVEFARMFVSRVAPSQAETLISRAAARLGSSLEVGRERRVDDEDSITYADVERMNVLLDNVERLELALRAGAYVEAAGPEDIVKGVTREGFRRACRAVFSHAGRRGESLSPAQEDVVFAMFDADGDGRISAEELCGVLNSASRYGLGEERGARFAAQLMRVPSCVKGLFQPVL